MKTLFLIVFLLFAGTASAETSYVSSRHYKLIIDGYMIVCTDYDDNGGCNISNWIKMPEGWINDAWLESLKIKDNHD